MPVMVLNMKEEVEDLISNHEEVDTRMCVLLKATDDNDPGNVAVRVADTCYYLTTVSWLELSFSHLDGHSYII